MSKKRKQVYKCFSYRVNPNRELDIPEQLHLDVNRDGVFFGHSDQEDHTQYIGMPQGSDGNILVLGGTGSGKSSGIVMPTLETWHGTICATDIKGELSEHYAGVSALSAQHGIERRPYIVFDPTQADGPGYDPFWLLEHDGELSLADNIKDIVDVIIPENQCDYQPFWCHAERTVLKAALHYYFQCGLGFSEAVCRLLVKGVSEFSREFIASNSEQAKIMLGEILSMNKEALASIDFGLRNELHLFASDLSIHRAFRGTRGGAACFHWGDLNRANIFLRIPETKVASWGPAINLMYAQLIHCLESRPERYSPSGGNNVQTLLLMDEFPQLGALPKIKTAISTLRSKNVNLCLVVQSLAQLANLYGPEEQKIILDNCQYKVILQANDADTQKTICDLIGETEVMQESVSRSLDFSGNVVGFSTQRSIAREYKVFPHQLSTLQDVILISPYGSSLLNKRQPNSGFVGGLFPKKLRRFSGNDAI